MRTTDAIKSIVEQMLEGTDLFLVDLKIAKNNVIEVFIDSAQGVNISCCSEINRKLEELLNREEEDFELTVSSAGIGYPFKVAGQYLKNIGNKVVVKFQDASRLEGILKAYDGTSLVLEYEEKKQLEGKKKKEIVKAERSIKLEDIKEIKDIVTF